MKYAVVAIVLVVLAVIAWLVLGKRKKYEPSPEAKAFARRRRETRGGRFTDIPHTSPAPAATLSNPNEIRIGVGMILFILVIILAVFVGGVYAYLHMSVPSPVATPVTNPVVVDTRPGFSLWQIFEIFLAIVMFFIILAWGIWTDAKAGGLLKFVGSNQIATFDGGDDTPVGVGANLPKGWVVKGLKIERGEKWVLNPIKFLMNRYGIFWKGFPTKTHIWSFIHERLNPKRSDDTPVTEWVNRDERPTSTDFFLFEKVHWVVVQGVEFKNKFRANILVQYWSRTRDLEKLYKLRGDVYPPMNNTIMANTRTQCSKHDYNDFITMDTDGTSNDPDNFCLQVADGACPVAMQEVGQEIYDVSVLFFDAADKETERLQSAEAAAKIKLAVSKLDAQGSVADVTELGARLKELFPDANPNVVMEQVGRLGAADRLARLTNLRAIGSGSVIGLDDQNTNTGSGGNKKATGKGGGKGGKK